MNNKFFSKGIFTLFVAGLFFMCSLATCAFSLSNPGANGYYNRSIDGDVYTGSDGECSYFYDSDTGYSVLNCD